MRNGRSSPLGVIERAIAVRVLARLLDYSAVAGASNSCKLRLREQREGPWETRKRSSTQRG